MTLSLIRNVEQRLSALRYVVAAMFASAAIFAFGAPAHAQSSGENSQVRALIASWAQDDRQRQGLMAIPSGQPVTADHRLSSNFGMRRHPIRGGRRMHNGIDMAGPVGTPIYATADGIVGRAQWVGGYGRYVEINHGSEIQTRYAHLSRILVTPGARVRRGQMIGRMGSTGRSTGSHLHYEVRIAGRPINPATFLRSNQYLASLPQPTAVASASETPTTPAGASVAVGASQ